MNNLRFLSIETSLDDTCAAITRGERVISSVISSQTNYHEEFGGVVPHIAKRLHQEFLDPTIREAMKRGSVEPEDIGAIAVTYGPGLAPALEQGIAKAQELSIKWNKPLIAVNHLEGHLLSSFAKNSQGTGGISNPTWPALGFIISGGHTQLVLIEKIGEYTLLGATLDDAAGEAYDKVARMLKLGYPGGPILSELAKTGNPRYALPIPMRNRDDLNFSFSGLKTAAKNKLKELKKPLSKQFIADFSASFQEAALTHLTDRFEKAIEQHNPQMILLGGGVVSSVELRKRTRIIARAHNIPLHIPYSKQLFTDNATMIGIVAYYKSKRKEFVSNISDLDREPNLNFDKINTNK